MIAIDTNLLVFAHRMQAPEHRAAREAIEKASRDSDGWGFALTNLLEFWSIVTHPAAPPRPSTPAEASTFVQALIRDADAQIWLPREGIGAAPKCQIILARALRNPGLSGPGF